jgi:ABC-type multidrug transport system ATPase subunit
MITPETNERQEIFVMQTDIVFEVHQLEKRYGENRAVQGIDLCVRRGEIYGFLGPNGAGKTTTIGMALGLIYPTAGEIRLFGQPVRPGDTRPLRRVGALVGSPSIVPYLSARQNLSLMARLFPHLPKGRVDEVLEWIGLSEAADRTAGKFSTGMKQRLGLGMALIDHPELLILDEPTNGMDPAGMREVRLLLASLAEQGITIFISSHLLNEIEQVCTRVAVLNRGKVVAEGPVSELLGHAFGQPLVKIQVDAPQEAAGLLRAMPGAANIQVNGEAVTVARVTSQSVILHLVSHGVVPKEVVNLRPNLEALFLELTQAK